MPQLAISVRGLELLGPGTHVELVSPGAPMLTMQHQIHFGDLVWGPHAVRAETRFDIGNKCADTNAIDDAIDDHMRNVDALRTEFPGNALRGHPESPLRRGERREISTAAQTPGGAGEDDRPGLT